jgi:hypothetical protein
MARNIRHRCESRTARLKLAVRKKPYSGSALGNGVLLYRRCVGNGTWVVKASDSKGGYWTKRTAETDDYAPPLLGAGTRVWAGSLPVVA